MKITPTPRRSRGDTLLNPSTVRNLRLAEGWLQADLAQRARTLSAAKIAVATVQRAETGVRITRPYARAIAEALKVKLPVLTALRGLPIIAVLPFSRGNIGEVRGGELAEVSFEVYRELKRYKALSVLGVNSTFLYRFRNKAEIRKIIRSDIGATYTIDGVLDQAKSQINVELIRLLKRGKWVSVWNFLYPIDLSSAASLLDARHQIAEAVAVGVSPRIITDARSTGSQFARVSQGAYFAYLAGMLQIAKGTLIANHEAARCFQNAMDLDPEFANAHAGMALFHVHAGISFSSHPNLDELKEAEKHARRALKFDPENADARAALANAVGPRGEHQAAIIEARRALAQEPNHAWAYGVIGAALTFDGHADQGLAYLDRSIELDRNDAMAPTREMQRVIAFYLSGKYDEAIRHGEQVVVRHRNMQLVYRWLAAAQGQLELFEPAAKTLGRARSINPEAYKHYSRKLAPWMRQVDHEHLLDGLTKAGWGRGD